MTTPTREELQRLGSAYLAMLRLPDGTVRLNCQHLLCALRDAIAQALNQDSESVQNEYEKRALLSAHQAQGEPTCRVTGYYAGRCVVDALDRSMILPTGMALYAAPPSSAQTNSEDIRNQVWNEAVEAAQRGISALEVHDVGHPWTAFTVQQACLDVIRSLKRPLQAQEPASPAAQSGATDDLPPLPMATHCQPYPGPDDAAFTADQMREYARLSRAQTAPQAWKYRVLVNKHTTGEVTPDQIQMREVWGRPSGWMVSMEKPTDPFLLDVIELHQSAAPVSEQPAASNGFYRWLEQAAKSDYAEVAHAARTMMAYYQGAEFPERPSLDEPKPCRACDDSVGYVCEECGEQPAAQTAGVPVELKLRNTLVNFHRNSSHPEADAGDVEAAISAIKRIFAPQPVAEQVVTEYGWLVENGKSGDELRYRTWRDGMSAWTADPNEATHYCRRIDAERAHQEDEDAWLITHHVWDSAHPQAAQAKESGNE